MTKLDAEIPGGALAMVTLDGGGVQLDNSAGNLVLHDDQTAQVNSVTYSAADAAAVDRSSTSGVERAGDCLTQPRCAELSTASTTGAAVPAQGGLLLPLRERPGRGD